jgi:hypothetical protein
MTASSKGTAGLYSLTSAQAGTQHALIEVGGRTTALRLDALGNHDCLVDPRVSTSRQSQ